MNIFELANTNVQIVVSAEDLKDFARQIIASVRAERAEAMIIQEQNDTQLLSTDEVCNLFKITKPTLWRWAKADYLKPVKVGSKNFYNKQDVERLASK